MAVIGLGFGAVGAYVSACGKCVFFETDLAVVTGYAAHGLSNLSERDSTRAQFNIVVGDPLVKLQENSECYEAMILDAFNCDPVLERLLTDEGLKVLESHLSEGGVLIFNISTEPVRLGTLLRELAAHAGLTVLYCNDVQLNDADLQSGKVPSNWAAMSRYPATLDQLVKDPRWTKDGSSWLDMMKPRN